jgi:uncharacterized protein (TIGR02145 family)
MKNYFILIAAAVLALGVSSCKKEAPAPEPSLEIVTASPMSVGSDGGEFEVEIKSNTKWKVTGYSANISAVAPQSGEGDAKVGFTVADNIGGDARTETINFTIDNGGINPAVTFTIQQAKGDLIYGDVTYRVAKMLDGRIWMQENLRYVPAGKTPSSDLATNTGVWYPVSFYDANANDLPATVTSVAFMTSAADVAKYGLLYNFATASGKDLSQIALVDGTLTDIAQYEKTQGICPDGWYIPTQAEYAALYQAYPFTPESGTADPTKIGIKTMVDMGFLAGPAGSVMVSNSGATPALNKLGYILSSTIASYSVSSSTGYTSMMMKSMMQNRTYEAPTTGSGENVQTNPAYPGIKNNYFTIANGSAFTGMYVRCIKAE